MMKSILFFLAMLTSAVSFAAGFTLDNQSSYPNKKGKIAIQWATSAKEAEESNVKLMQGLQLNKNSLLALTKTGKIQLTIPPNVTYFRVLAWSQGGAEPDLLSNWISIAPEKTYTLTDAYLVPSVLMIGMGC